MQFQPPSGFSPANNQFSSSPQPRIMPGISMSPPPPNAVMNQAPLLRKQNISPNMQAPMAMPTNVLPQNFNSFNGPVMSSSFGQMPQPVNGGFGVPAPQNQFGPVGNQFGSVSPMIPIGNPMPIPSFLQRGVLMSLSPSMRIGSNQYQGSSFDLDSLKSNQASKIDTTIIPQQIYCVICNKKYSVLDKDKHIEVHKRQKQGTKIKKLPEYKPEQKKGPQARPIVQPEEYNIQYNPNSFILQQQTNFSTVAPAPVAVSAPPPSPPAPVLPTRSQFGVSANPQDISSSTVPRSSIVNSNIPIAPVVPAIPGSQSVSNIRPETVRLTKDGEQIISNDPNMYQGGRIFKQDPAVISQQARQTPLPDARLSRDTFLSDRPSSVVQPYNNQLFGRQTLQSQQFRGTQASQQPKLLASKNTGLAPMPVISEQPADSRILSSQKIQLEPALHDTKLQKIDSSAIRNSAMHSRVYDSNDYDKPTFNMPSNIVNPSPIQPNRNTVTSQPSPILLQNSVPVPIIQNAQNPVATQPSLLGSTKNQNIIVPNQSVSLQDSRNSTVNAPLQSSIKQTTSIDRPIQTKIQQPARATYSSPNNPNESSSLGRSPDDKIIPRQLRTRQVTNSALSNAEIQQQPPLSQSQSIASQPIVQNQNRNTANSVVTNTYNLASSQTKLFPQIPNSQAPMLQQSRKTQNSMVNDNIINSNSQFSTPIAAPVPALIIPETPSLSQPQRANSLTPVLAEPARQSTMSNQDIKHIQATPIRQQSMTSQNLATPRQQNIISQNTSPAPILKQQSLNPTVQTTPFIKQQSFSSQVPNSSPPLQNSVRQTQVNPNPTGIQSSTQNAVLNESTSNAYGNPMDDHIIPRQSRVQNSQTLTSQKLSNQSTPLNTNIPAPSPTINQTPLRTSQVSPAPIVSPQNRQTSFSGIKNQTIQPIKPVQPLQPASTVQPVQQVQSQPIRQTQIPIQQIIGQKNPPIAPLQSSMTQQTPPAVPLSTSMNQPINSVVQPFNTSQSVTPVNVSTNLSNAPNLSANMNTNRITTTQASMAQPYQMRPEQPLNIIQQQPRTTLTNTVESVTKRKKLPKSIGGW